MELLGSPGRTLISILAFMAVMVVLATAAARPPRCRSATLLTP